MQLSTLYASLCNSIVSNRVSNNELSLRTLGSSCFVASVILLASSQAALAQIELNNTNESDLPSVTLETIVVVSSADASADGLPSVYEGGQVATGSRVGLLGNQDIMDTPFSTTSYTNDYISNQQAQSVGDVLKKDPTVRLGRGFGNFQEAYFIRGFITTSDDTMYNGLYGILPRQYIASELFERVEVQRGASAMLNGSTPGGISSGGAINLLPKRAGNDPSRQVTVGYGEGEQGRLALDVSDRFGTDDALGVRFNAVYQDGNTAVDDESATLGLASLGLDYRGDRYRLSADLGWQNNELDETRTSVTLKGDSKVPEAPDGSNNWAQPWTYSNEEDIFGTIRAEFDFNDSLTGYAAYGARSTEEDNALANLRGVIADGSGTQYRFDNSREDSVQSGEIGLRGELTTETIDHNWVIEADIYDKEEKGAYGYDYPNQLTTSIYDPIKYDNVPLTSTAKYGGDLDNPKRVSEIRLQSYALADSLSMFDNKLKTTLGVRHQSIDITSYDYKTHEKSSEYDKSEWTPSIGIVYQPNFDWSIYGNYIESLEIGKQAPNTSNGQPVSNAGQYLDPYVSKQIEVGVKYDNGYIGGTLAGYRINQPRAYVNGAQKFVSDGENSHQGLELTVFGSPIKNMRLNAGVSYLDAKQEDTGDTTLDGNNVIGIPSFQGNLNLEYDVAALEGLTLTGDIIHTGSRYADAANTQKVDGYTTLDIGGRYRTTLAGQDVTIKGVVTNVTGEDYWQSVGGYPGAGYLNAGDPTALKLSATFDF